MEKLDLNNLKFHHKKGRILGPFLNRYACIEIARSYIYNGQLSGNSYMYTILHAPLSLMCFKIICSLVPLFLLPEKTDNIFCKTIISVAIPMMKLVLVMRDPVSPKCNFSSKL